MLALDAKQARLIDEKSVDKYKIPLSLLMENAGNEVAKVIKKNYKNQGEVIFVAGVGNNGADGLVAARHLLADDIPFRIIQIGDLTRASELFNLQASIFAAMNISIANSVDLSQMELKYIFATAEIIVDGIMGTGLCGNLRENAREITALINESKAQVIAIDVPTGVNVDNGSVSEDAILADYTVTMVAPKLGMNLYPAKNNCGKIIICGIGTPKAENIITEKQNIIIDEQLISNILPKRSPICHKGDNGHVLIAGGSIGMYGAPLLAAEASINSGAGKTTLGVSLDCYEEIMNKASNEIMGARLPMDFDDILYDENIRALTKDKDSIAIGPGMGRSIETKLVVDKILANYDGPLLLDADAIYVLNQNVECISNREIPTVITPHVGEFAHLTGYSAKTIERNRVEIARRYAEENQLILVLKGAPTVIALPNGNVYINPTGNPGMATGGMGDVLTGTIAAFIAQGLLIEEAVILGVYLHGLSADILQEEKIIGYTAGAVAKGIGRAFTKINK